MVEITKPTLIVDELKAKANIDRMVAKARRLGVPLRPHFKTHQSSDIGEWFRQAGVDRITVSSVSMAKYFSDHGWKDITIAFPYNPLESQVISEITEKSKVNLLIESEESWHHFHLNTPSGTGYFIKIDVGTRRTGIPVSRMRDLKELVDLSTDDHPFLGLLAHAGHSYRSRSANKIHQVFQEGMEIIHQFEKYLGFRPFISWGDTPTCSVVEDMPGVNELRAGNFVFYDVMQHQIGSCEIDDIAVVMACPVVAVHKNRDEAVIYGGAVHFSKDALNRSSGQGYFGELVTFGEKNWSYNKEAILDRISQEHGIVKGSSSFIKSLKVGDILGILPVHSCLTADLMPGYRTLDGKELNKLAKTL